MRVLVLVTLGLLSLALTAEKASDNSRVSSKSMNEYTDWERIENGQYSLEQETRPVQLSSYERNAVPIRDDILYNSYGSAGTLQTATAYQTREQVHVEERVVMEPHVVYEPVVERVEVVEEIIQPIQVREVIHRVAPPPRQYIQKPKEEVNAIPPVRAAARSPPPEEKESSWSFPWLFLLPLLCCCCLLPLLLLLCCCPKAKKVQKGAAAKQSINMSFPETNPVRAVAGKHQERLVDEEVKRELATIQRTIVQEVQIPVEEYESLYGSKQGVTKVETLPAQYKPVRRSLAEHEQTQETFKTKREVFQSSEKSSTRGSRKDLMMTDNEEIVNQDIIYMD